MTNTQILSTTERQKVFSLRRAKLIGAAFLAIAASLGLFLVIGLMSPQTLLSLAELSANHAGYIRLINAVLAVLCAFFFFLPRDGSHLVGRWNELVGMAFFTFFVFYGLRFVYETSGGHLDPVLRSAIGKIVEAVSILLSSFNNLLILAAARILLNKNKRTQNYLSLWDEPEVSESLTDKVMNFFEALRAALPGIAWAMIPLGLIALLEDTIAPYFLWVRFPDALFSIYCLAWFAYAMWVNFRARGQRFIAALAFVAALSYGSGQLVYAANPIIIYPGASALSAVRIVRESLGNKISEGVLDSAVFAVLLPMKYVLFLPAFFLYLLSIFSVTDLRRALKDTTSRQYYLSPDGIIKAIGKSFEADEVTLFIKLPGVKKPPGPNKVRAIGMTWTVEDSSPKQNQFSPFAIDREPELVKMMTVTGEPVIKASQIRQYGSDGRAGSLIPRTMVWIPVKFHGGVIGGLRVDLSGYGKFNEATLQKLKLFAQLVAPSVQDFRIVAAVEKIGLRLTYLQVDYPTNSFAAAVDRITEALHDVLGPLVTGLLVESGFFSFKSLCPEGDSQQRKETSPNGNGIFEQTREAYKVMVEQKMSEKRSERIQIPTSAGVVRLEKDLLFVRMFEENPSSQVDSVTGNRHEVGKVSLGNLMLAIPDEKDDLAHPTLAAYYLNRRTLASLTANGIFETARSVLSAIIAELGVDFSKETLTEQKWFEHLSSAVNNAGLLWVVVMADGVVRHGKPEHIEILASLNEDCRQQLQKNPLSSIRCLAPDSATHNIIHLKLRGSKHRLFLGVTRKDFGKELTFPSPWRVFLEQLANIADAPLVGMLDTETERQKGVERLKASRNEGWMTMAVNNHELTHQLVNMVKDQRNAAESLLGAAMSGDIQLDRQTVRLLGAIKASAEEMQELIRAYNDVAKMDNHQPCTIRDAAQQAAKLCLVKLTQKRVSFQIHLSREDTVDLPFSVLVMVLANLIGNAIDAIQPKGHIEVTVSDTTSDGCVICHVSNDGPEIPTDLWTEIFEPGVSTKDGHYGWGLHLVTGDLKKYGGHIRVADSSTVRTRFELSLPTPKCEPVL